MDIGLKTRKQVSLNLLNELEFMKCHRDLARGLTRSRRGKLHSLKSWNSCAKKLNALKDGTTKDAKGWSKYWCDCKYRVRRRALEYSVANENDRKPPDGVIPLSRLEEGVLSIIGDNAIDGVVIKTDPLAYDEEEHADYNMSNMNTATFTNNIVGIKPGCHVYFETYGNLFQAMVTKAF
ncbi:unnamed protein product [Parnassius apollo]|uniref:(apollo) hypothetical protein n=1 Tax=Parnassius apollo TaxID=110799 RepID=A0A8S3X293_PARAO|nr:unnamed protein product [Parnassius apollo]